MAKKGKGRGKDDGEFVRVTGFFRTKKNKKLYVGKMEKLGGLRKLLKEAAEDEKAVVFFLKYWPDADSDEPKFSLSAAIDKPQSKKIKDSDEDEDDGDELLDDDDSDDEDDDKGKKDKGKDAEEEDPFSDD